MWYNTHSISKSILCRNTSNIVSLNAAIEVEYSYSGESITQSSQPIDCRIKVYVGVERSIGF